MEQDCRGAWPLIQAELDGELDAAQAATLAAHVAGCAACTGVRRRLAALSSRVRAEVPYYPAPAALRQAVRAMAPAPPWHRVARRFWPLGGAAVAGALAASLAFMVAGAPGSSELPGAVVAAHLRAAQPGHLLDITSDDRHQVKPWFQGKLDYAPPVRSFPAAGFVLEGGRLDVLDGRPVAALVYRHDRHALNLFTWPGSAAPGRGTRLGFNWVRWSADGMVFWAVSDLTAADMDAFAALWREPAKGRND